MVWHWFRKPAGEIPCRFKSCTLRNDPQREPVALCVEHQCERVGTRKPEARRCRGGVAESASRRISVTKSCTLRQLFLFCKPLELPSRRCYY